MTILEELQNQYEVLNSCNLRIHAYWSQFLMLFTVSDEQMTILAQTASGFFKVIQDSLRDNVFIMISRITDPPRTGNFDNMSINRMVESLDGNIDPSQLAEITTQVSKLNDKCEGIRQWRKKWFAHIDLDFALQNNPTVLPPVKRGEIDRIIHHIDETLKLIAKSLGLPSTEYTVNIFGDAQDLVNILKRKKEHH